MKVGFTGTRNGMTVSQWNSLANEFDGLGVVTEFHHGDCVGADDEAANTADNLFPGCVVCHPPVDDSHRAFNSRSKVSRQPKTHFARNRDIVDETDLLIGTPAQMERQTHGGTWYTLDYAKKKGKRVIIIYPDGSVNDAPARADAGGGQQPSAQGPN